MIPIKTKPLLLTLITIIIGSSTIAVTGQDKQKAKATHFVQNTLRWNAMSAIEAASFFHALLCVPLHLGKGVQGQGTVKTISHMLGHAVLSPIPAEIKAYILKEKENCSPLFDQLLTTYNTPILRSLSYCSLSILYLVGMLLTKAPLATLLTKTTKTLSNDYLQALLQILLKPLKSLEASGPVQRFMLMKCLEICVLYGPKPLWTFYTSYCNDIFGFYT